MSRQKFWLTKTELPPEYAQQGGKILWRPSFVFFLADYSTKGYAFFTTRDNADGYRLLLEALDEYHTYPVTVEQFDDIPGYAACVTEHIRSANKAYKDVPVYIDPPNLYCKGVKTSYASLQKFLYKNFQEQMPYGHEVVGFTHQRGCTIQLLRDKASNKFTAVCMRGVFQDRATISAAIEDAIGTTDEVYYKCSEPSDDAEAALAIVAEHIQRVAPDTGLSPISKT